jgi:HD-like signal output (HDOD) protein/ActR/RegA family two-component response regulator
MGVEIPEPGLWEPAAKPLKRILFVDDEHDVLDSLHDALRRYRKVWDVRFATSGDDALAQLEEEPADVIVSDIQMPVMNGALLLARIQELYPATIRIVLSGYADCEIVAHAATAAHRILAKPCDLEALCLILERSCKLHELSEVAELYRLTVATTTLPSRPGLYTEITKVIANPASSPDEIAAVIEQDAAMTAKVLQLANSAFFGNGRSVTSVRDAVVHLGADTIKSLTVSAETFSKLAPQSVEGFSIEDFQLHAMLVARIAAGILPPGELQQDAVTAALLHDIGKLVAISDDRDRWTRLSDEAQTRGLPRYAVERDHDEVTHAATGAYLLALWGLPLGVVEAVAGHHDPDLLPGVALDAIAAVHIADALAHEVRSGLGDGAPAPKLDPAYLDRLGVRPQLAGWRRLALQAAATLPASTATG